MTKVLLSKTSKSSKIKNKAKRLLRGWLAFTRVFNLTTLVVIKKKIENILMVNSLRNLRRSIDYGKNVTLCSFKVLSTLILWCLITDCNV